MRLKDLINWYLKEVESEIDTVQELTDKKLLVEKVIDRLVNHVSESKPPHTNSVMYLCSRSKPLPCDIDYPDPQGVYIPEEQLTVPKCVVLTCYNIYSNLQASI